ncbi:IQ motif, EF-hand binding site [Trema orientale]|uniref:IQ motif, EF-hand binding site n=1 Tax=Trema orientale TaxID=63057 RepID=A0A2P5F7T4_TREOI|nr:IQ motif, EF-hand binding site [Trema orientale]
MGKSTSSCFKIITCGSDSADKDDLELTANQWPMHLFIRRSEKNRGSLSETEFECDYLINWSWSLFIQMSVMNQTITPETGHETGAENEDETSAKLDETVVIAIQTAVRGFLAYRELLKRKNVIKLQAAVRGHLVRRHAVGTLRCVQAIVKMQALVRARHARLSMEGPCQNSDQKKQEILANKSNGVSASIEKLLSNKFARQLLESTPKTKPINVKCDPSKSDSAWKWLERWMSVSSVNAAESKKTVSVTEQQKEEENFDSKLEESRVEPEVICESVDSKLSVQESVVRSESEDNLITYEADKFDFQGCYSTASSVRDNLEQPQPENTSTSDVKESSVEINSLLNETLQSDVDSQLENNSLQSASGEPETEAEQPKRSMKRLATDELETEGNKFVHGSKKASNPSFIVAQSKFEELSSAVNPDRALSSSYQESGDESYKDTFSFEAHSVIRTKELVLAESPVHGSKLQVGGSECGTELSVTSTLDSPDRSDIVAMEHEPESKVSEEEICAPNKGMKSLDLEANDGPAIPESSLSHSVPDQPEKLDVAYGDSVSSVVTTDSPRVELKPERDTSDFQRELEQQSQAGVQAHVLSPEASPRSHMTGAESQGTPASQVSVKTKRNRSDKRGSDQNRDSLSAIKKSPSNTNHDSGSRSSVEKLPKDQKNGKRRNSFGSPKPDISDQEPRDSSSNSSLPHFMQATESARAKLNANSSPRSSPDVQDREIYVKKRHSLPGANGRQGSPHIQRSTSQAQQGGAKANGIHTSPHIL